MADTEITVTEDVTTVEVTASTPVSITTASGIGFSPFGHVSSTDVQNALEEIKTLSVDDALKLVKEDKCNLVDIRDIRELDKQGRIDNSAHIPRGMLEFWMDPQSEYFKNGKIDMKKEIVLFCAGGLRSALATKSLKDMGYKNV